MRKIQKIVGIGGIGTGMLFHLDNNNTIGRNESRLAEISAAKDFCKLQIILYYPATILSHRVTVYPAGYVGQDAWGEKIQKELSGQGMDLKLLQTTEKYPTMFSVCWQYPDKAGGNLTASNSACGLVTPEFVRTKLEQELSPDTMVLAAPEVSVSSRIELLRLGHQKGAFCVSSVAASEANDFWEQHAFRFCDLLAINEEEAQALAGRETSSGKILVQKLYDLLKIENPQICLVVTCGGEGAYTVEKGRIEFVPPDNVTVRNTTGAGDAFLGGTMAGLCMGLPFQKGKDDRFLGESSLSSAAELGALCASMAVAEEDSIAFHVGADSFGFVDGTIFPKQHAPKQF